MGLCEGSERLALSDFLLLTSSLYYEVRASEDGRVNRAGEID